MSELIRCPDCGGIVGAKEATDQGPPCTCFGQPGYKSEDVNSGTQVMPAQTAQKVCCMCGKDLAGKKRFKDSRGYWCPECSEEDARSKEDKGTPCEHCGRKVPEQSMTSVDGKMLCVRCVREQRELRAPGNKKFRAVNDRAFKEHEKKKMLIMGGILVVLLVLMIYAFMHFPALH
jgi:DNA-directed RNA polymerase subunit RPC12/RpoP